jgi:hypothetical protein
MTMIFESINVSTEYIDEDSWSLNIIVEELASLR